MTLLNKRHEQIRSDNPELELRPKVFHSTHFLDQLLGTKYGQIGKGGVAKNTGKWENGGRRIILKSGRILDSGSVWTNIANAITAI